MKLSIVNRRSILFFITLIFLHGHNLFALQDHKYFEQGNQQFVQGNYMQACKSYQNIEQKGFVVLYNIQLCYLYQSKIGQAFLYGKRAEKQASFKQLTQLYELFDCVKREIDPDYSIEWYDQLAIFVKKCILSISMILLQLIVLLMIIIAIILWYRSWYAMHKQLFLMIISIGLFFIILLGYKISIVDQSVGIVIKNEINVFAGPDTSFYKKLQLHESDELIVINKQQGYYQVKAKQVIGWVCDTDIELV